jgi:nicotinate-nucleotide pyrophosphorylase (carboxylating)
MDQVKHRHGRPGSRPIIPDDIAETIRRALEEDIGSGDVTATLLPPSLPARATVVSREATILCGAPWFERVFSEIDANTRVTWHALDGDAVTPEQPLCLIEGTARALLTGERTALNFLQTLSGTAGIARRYAEAVKGTRTRILDTRKTLPGLRTAQKYAVRCGGCDNHRLGLFDAVLIKENHILAAGSIQAAIARARQHNPNLPIEVEVETLEELKAALEWGADSVLLDNFNLDQVRAAVRLNADRAKLEVSGGIELDGIRALAETGVDYISVGALTKHVRAADFSMRFEPQSPHNLP